MDGLCMVEEDHHTHKIRAYRYGLCICHPREILLQLMYFYLSKKWKARKLGVINARI